MADDTSILGLTPVKPGDPVLADSENMILAAVQAMQRSSGPGMNSDSTGLALRELLAAQGWWGYIMDAGPSSEADYTDARYWVQRQQFSNDDGDSTEAVTVQPLDTSSESALWITATNLAEIANDDTGRPSTHLVTEGTMVFVVTVAGLDGTIYSVFGAGPAAAAARIATATGVTLDPYPGDTQVAMTDVVTSKTVQVLVCQPGGQMLIDTSGTLRAVYFDCGDGLDGDGNKLFRAITILSGYTIWTAAEPS